MITRNPLSLAIAVAITTMAHGVTGVRQNVIRKPRDVRREHVEPEYHETPHQSYRERMRRNNKPKYHELLDAERQDRGLPSTVR